MQVNSCKGICYKGCTACLEKMNQNSQGKEFFQCKKCTRLEKKRMQGQSACSQCMQESRLMRKLLSRSHTLMRCSSNREKINGFLLQSPAVFVMPVQSVTGHEVSFFSLSLNPFLLRGKSLDYTRPTEFGYEFAKWNASKASDDQTLFVKTKAKKIETRRMEEKEMQIQFTFYKVKESKKQELYKHTAEMRKFPKGEYILRDILVKGIKCWIKSVHN